MLLFVWGLFTQSRIIYLYSEVTITSEGIQILDTQGNSVVRFLTRATCLHSHVRGSVTLTIRAERLAVGAVTICFND